VTGEGLEVDGHRFCSSASAGHFLSLAPREKMAQDVPI
jgi:hypothetical protein